MKLASGGNYGLVLNGDEMWRVSLTIESRREEETQEQRRFALHSLRDVGLGPAMQVTQLHGDLSSCSLHLDTIISYGHEIVKRWRAEGDNAFDVTPNIMVRE